MTPFAPQPPNATPPKHQSLLMAFVFSAVALAAYGATRLLFNLLGLHLFSVELVGRVNGTLAGAATVAVLCAAPIGTALTTAVAHRAAVANQSRTRETLATFWLAGTTIVAVAAALWYLIQGIDAGLYAASYLLCFGCYLLTRAAMLGEHRHDLLARFEVLGFVTSMTWLTIACVSRSEPMAMMVLLIHPAAVTALSLFRYRSLVASFSWRQSQQDGREHIGLIGAAFLLSLSGVASYHLVLAILSARGRPEAEIGFIATLLSALGVFSLAPLALSMILMPEQARQQGLGNARRQQALVRRPTVALQAVFSALFLLIVGGASYALPILGISASAEHLGFWGAACASSLLSIISTPSGSFLNGVSAAREQAVISVVCFGAGCVSSWMISAVSGAGGAAAMLVCSVGLASLARIVAADAKIGSLAPGRIAFWVRTTLTVGSLLALNYIPSIAIRVGLVVVVIGSHWGELRLIAQDLTSRLRHRLAPARAENE